MARRLPGIGFETVPPPVKSALPRMDVAAFVGLAASGPLHTPVAVEDAVHFAEIFGEALTLAWDEEEGRAHRAYLAPAVRSFFENGGRRCWVVRVAGEEAETGRFLVPGLIRVPGGDAGTGAFASAAVAARSEGAWSDRLRVRAALQREALGASELRLAGDQAELAVSKRSRVRVAAGDLLRVTVAEAGGLVLFLVADSVGDAVAGSGAAGDPVWRVRGRAFWFGLDGPDAGAVPLIGLQYLPPDGAAQALEPARWEAGPGEHRVLVPREGAPGIGALLEAETPGGRRYLLTVSGTRPAAPAEAPGIGPAMLLTARAALRPLEAAEVAALLPGAGWTPARAERLTMQLQAEEERGRRRTLQALGFARPHPRFLGDLPSDAALFGASGEEQSAADGEPPGRQLWADAAEPRFPLAGAGEAADLYLPLTMGWFFRTEEAAGPLEAQRPAPVRNGLASFSPDLFLDPDLAALGAETLPGVAFHKRHVRGERLLGLHSLWEVEEATLLAVPDAVHPPWGPVTVLPPEPLAAPALSLVEEEAAGGGGQAVALVWTEVATATGYAVEAADDPLFTLIVMQARTDGTRFAPPEPEGCPRLRYYRVRAERPGEVGPWSNTAAVLHGAGPFDRCEPAGLPAPELRSEGNAPSGASLLAWTAVPGAEGYVLEESADPAFAGAREAYQGTEAQASVVRTSERATYYRVRALRGAESSPWSNTVTLSDLRPTELWRLSPPGPDAGEGLLKLHRAMLRFAAGRADVLAVLGLPVRYREEESLSHVRLLTHGLDGERRALSYGALYHPWPEVVTGGGERLPTPPDGAVIGRMADRTLRRGAWVAPANEVLAGAVSLRPELGAEAPVLFAGEQVNLIRRHPRGHLLLSADTLSPDPELRPISVRRLLILLRWLALREGQSLVFQPNDATFRRTVVRRFEAVLGDLFRRGAFAGQVQEEAFRVVADRSVNTRQSMEQGRFVVELRVAPSHPLTFLQVRLVQTHGAGAVATEV